MVSYSRQLDFRSIQEPESVVRQIWAREEHQSTQPSRICSASEKRLRKMMLKCCLGIPAFTPGIEIKPCKHRTEAKQKRFWFFFFFFCFCFVSLCIIGKCQVSFVMEAKTGCYFTVNIFEGYFSNLVVISNKANASGITRRFRLGFLKLRSCPDQVPREQLRIVFL